jgi:hypothetical protein
VRGQWQTQPGRAQNCNDMISRRQALAWTSIFIYWCFKTLGIGHRSSICAFWPWPSTRQPGLGPLKASFKTQLPFPFADIPLQERFHIDNQANWRREKFAKLLDMFEDMQICRAIRHAIPSIFMRATLRHYATRPKGH